MITRLIWLSLALLSLLSSWASDAAGAYEQSWESLTKHQVPEWILDAKFGIYAHWGVYSVPAFGNEWYARRMYDKNDSTFEFHRKKYGEPSKFGYKDLVPLFTAEDYDPGEWAEVIAKSGAKYVVHHDGFGLWDSDVSDWNVGKMGPRRDLYGGLVTELCKKPDMKIIATFHHIRTFDWYPPRRQELIEQGRKAGRDIFDPRYRDYYWNRFIGKYEDFIAQWQGKVAEVVDKYKPDVLWFDGGKFQEEGTQHIVLSVLQNYLNKAEQWGKEVEVLNKLPAQIRNTPKSRKRRTTAGTRRSSARSLEY